ncbi:MAG: L,D-transpeptidase family protein [Paracoccaceae bacterium]
MVLPVFSPRVRGLGRWVGMLAVAAVLGAPALATPSGFAGALAGALGERDAVLAAFYRDRAYGDLWTGPDDAARRGALLHALGTAPLHGLPVARYDAAAFRLALAAARTEADRARIEAGLSRAYLDFASDLAAGALRPGAVDSDIKRSPERPDRAALLAHAEAGAEAVAGLLAGLVPRQPHYARLMKEKIALEAQIAAGAPLPAIAAERLAMGDAGAEVVTLRRRLRQLGYLGPSARQDFDRAMALAVQRFQTDMGLPVDGVVAGSTRAALNASAQDRLLSVVVALERLRWMGQVDLARRHVWVNQPAFSVQIMDKGRAVFDSRVVIGKNGAQTRSPEFSDQMQFMVVNPSWSVPRSITTQEYLPLLRQDPGAVSHLQLIDRNGREVPREGVDFAAYSAKDFPFGLRQAPSDRNALGKVKFMFPNAHNIYLHDTPEKKLFGHEVRAFSHGCIRVGSPLDFAYALLSLQSDDPQGLFAAVLAGGQESRLDLDQPLPVHLVYFTAWPNARGVISYRADVYGRDARIFDALVEAGLAPAAVQG